MERVIKPDLVTRLLYLDSLSALKDLSFIKKNQSNKIASNIKLLINISFILKKNQN